MAPEQARAGAVDARVDLYATGVVLYEMLAGVRPFVADSDAEILAAILNAEIPPISARRDDVPAPIDAITKKLLSRSPDDRYPTASDALRALAVHAPADGSIRLGDQMAEWLGSGASVPAREATIRIQGAVRPESEGPVVPAGADAATRTRRPSGGADAGEPAFAYAATAPGKSARTPAPSPGLEGSTTTSIASGDIELESSTRTGTSTGVTPAPVTRTGAIAAGTLTPSPVRGRVRGRLWALAGGVAVTAFAGVVWVALPGAEEAPIVVTAAPATAVALASPTTPPPAATPSPAPPSSASVAVATSAPEVVARRPEERGTGTLFVTAIPWAEVQLDGRALPGQTPQTIEDVPVGRHRVVFTGPGGTRKTKTVTVHRALRAEARVTFGTLPSP
jgi:serine/threonine-protein kinase